MRLLAKQPIVVGMAANPEPDESIGRFDGQGSVVGADPRRPEPADFLEVKDAADLASDARTIDRRDRVPRTARTDIAPGSREMRDESEGCGLAGGVITKGLGSKVV